MRGQPSAAAAVSDRLWLSAAGQGAHRPMPLGARILTSSPLRPHYLLPVGWRVQERAALTAPALLLGADTMPLVRRRPQTSMHVQRRRRSTMVRKSRSIGQVYECLRRVGIVAFAQPQCTQQSALLVICASGPFVIAGLGKPTRTPSPWGRRSAKASSSAIPAHNLQTFDRTTAPRLLLHGSAHHHGPSVPGTPFAAPPASRLRLAAAAC
jgi:hypothetical protein